jgi:hypothetical protein
MTPDLVGMHARVWTRRQRLMRRGLVDPLTDCASMSCLLRRH